MDQDHQSASESRRESLAKKAASLGEDAQAKLAETAEPVKDKARSAAEEQKRAGADQVASLGAAVHGAAGELEKELPQLPVWSIQRQKPFNRPLPIFASAASKT